MPLYTCEYCNYSTNLLGNYKRHIKTKKHHRNITGCVLDAKGLGVKSQNEPQMSQNEPQMSQNEPQMSQNEPQMSQFKCSYCGECFKTKANKRRHELHRCKENVIIWKDKKIKRLEMEINDWKKEKVRLYSKIDELIGKVGVTNNIQNNIIINNYGEEDMSHITSKIMNELVKIPYGAIPKLIESVHFNDEKPENKNIILPNKKENILKIYHGDKWVYKNRSEAIKDLIDSKYQIIDNHYDIIKENISGLVKNSYTKFRKYYDQKDEELVKELQKECDLVLLNHRD